MTLYFTQEDPAGAVGAALIRELSAELAPIYGGDGSGAFAPTDMDLPRTAFVVAWLDGDPDVVREPAQRGVEKVGVRTQRGRQLQEYRPQPVTQPARPIEEPRHRLRRIR